MTAYISDLPTTWLSLKLGDVVAYGKTEKAEPGDFAPETWVLELEDLEKDTTKVLQRLTFADRQSKSTKNKFNAGDVLYGKLRPYLNKVTFADRPGVCTTEIVPIKPNEAVHGRYLFHWLRHPAFLTYVTEVSHGVNMPRLGTDAGRDAPFVLAPKAEQKRIADKLDTVLTRVDAVNTRLARVAPLLKRFRQSVLAAATSGRLTEDWRKTEQTEFSGEGRLPVGWRLAKFKDICTEITVGFVGKMSDQYVDAGVPFLRSMNVRPFRFDETGLQYISAAFHQQIAKSCLRPGDLAIVRSGAPGVCCVIPDSLTTANCSDLVIARPGPDLLAGYGCIFMNSSFGAAHVASKLVGVAQAHFNVGSMKETPLPLPPVEEQTEIVRRVETLFAFADRLEARLAQAQTAATRLTPALLAKAFRGELVPQDPNDEPAAELLRRLQAERASAPKASTGRGRKAAVQV